MTFQQWFWSKIPDFSGELLFDEPLSKHTYYRLGGPVPVLAVPKSREDLEIISEGIQATQTPMFILGAGSNVLASDLGFEGLVIKTTKLNLDIALNNPHNLKTGAGVPISFLLRKAAQEGWGGLELLTGIPGTVGGVVSMNAGTHLGETKDLLQKVTVYSLGPEKGFLEFSRPQFKFEYRKNLFTPENALVYSAEWEIKKENPAQVKAQIDALLVRRKQTQPIDFPSCGCVFKNPAGHNLKAWQIIEELWMSGHQIGGAQFSEKHCNFIVNTGSAKAADVKALIDLAKSRAQKELGIALHEEVRYLGKF